MIHTIFEFLRSLTDPDRLIHLLTTMLTGWWGYATLFAIVFSETGLLVGFFLPGDSLLFTVGVVCGAGQLDVVWVTLLLIAAAILGNSVGYTLGRKAGPHVFKRPDSRLFRREHLERTQRFYEKHGGKTMIYAEFLPIIRTFAAFVAGVAEMKYSRFISFNFIGSIGWVFVMIQLGYRLGGIPIVRQNFEKVILLIIFVSLLPAFSHAWQAWRESKSQPIAK